MCDCNTTSECQESVSCTCKVLLSSDCTNNFTADLPCSNILKGQTLTETIVALDAYICTKFDSVTNFFDLINVGAGSQVYKGVSMLGKKEMRTLVDSGLINLVQGTNDITISVDEAALNTYIEANQKTYSAANIGTGANIYKDTTIVGDNTQFNLRKINTSNSGTGAEVIKTQVENTNDISIIGRKISSSTLTVTQLTDEVTIEAPATSDIPAFIVNSDYTGDIELGTAAKPFKNLQNALDAYVGNGASNKVPDNVGTVIIVQKDINTFIGSLAYAGLNLSIENTATLTSNPSTGTKLQDLDSDATLPTNPNYSMLPFGNAESVDVSITIKRGGAIQLQKEGLKNRGNTLNTGGSLGKIIRIFGDSSGIYKTAEASVVSPSTQSIFSLNEDNQTGFYNDGAEACVFVNGATIQSFNSKIAYVGLGTKLKIADSTIQFGSGVVPFNIATVPFQLNGGNVTFENSSINNPLLLTNLVSLKTQTATGAIFNGVNSKLGDSCDYIFSNLDTGSTTSNQLVLDKCSNYTTQVESFVKNFMSSNLWNIKLTNCNTVTWGVNEAKIALIPSSLNTLGGQVVTTVSEYASKAAAVTAGLFNGSVFINKKSVTAGAFVVGEEYKILTIGSTDFTLIGASANTIGLYFIASGVGAGTGTASSIKLDIII